jgi:NTP pyrophosphatase (non-canonical NTP hydrolase)
MITQQDLDDMGYNYYSENKVPPSTMDMVKEFSRVLGQKPSAALYATLIQEEFDEWLEADAWEEDDLKELADLVYVVYGYANACGYDLDEAIRRVHANNLGRCVQPDGSILRREDGKIIKNKNYPKVKLDDLVGSNNV